MSDRLRSLLMKLALAGMVAAPALLLNPAVAKAGTTPVPCEAIGESMCCRCPTSDPRIDCAMIQGPGHRECTTTLCDPVTCGLWD